MTGEEGWASSPTHSPLFVQIQRDEHWRNFDNSANAVSFGFVATAILISMFLVMAVFERFLRPTSLVLSPSRDLESSMSYNPKNSHPSPQISVYSRGVSVLMPGEDVPTFIAHPAPAPCYPERPRWPSHQPTSLPRPLTGSNSVLQN